MVSTRSSSRTLADEFSDEAVLRRSVQPKSYASEYRAAFHEKIEAERSAKGLGWFTRHAKRAHFKVLNVLALPILTWWEGVIFFVLLVGIVVALPSSLLMRITRAWPFVYLWDIYYVNTPTGGLEGWEQPAFHIVSVLMLAVALMGFYKSAMVLRPVARLLLSGVLQTLDDLTYGLVLTVPSGFSVAEQALMNANLTFCG